MSAPVPRDDFIRYLVSYPEEMAFESEEPAAILDRYHTDDFEQYNDGLLLDRERLIAHVRPVRRNATSCRVDVHEAVVSGDTVAARYTLHAALRKGRVTATEIYMFGCLAPDGRISRIDQVTRTLPVG